MKISCKCLNVIIESKGSDIDEIDIVTLDVPQHDFFKEIVGTVELIKIYKEQAILVEMQAVGSWVIHRCLNCQIFTHAFNRDKGAASLLVNKSLITDPDVIKELRSSEHFSPVFNIVITQNEDDDVFPKTIFSGRNQSTTSSLHQVLTAFIQRESALTEERVRAYTDQQSAALESLRTKAHQDHQHLVRLLTEANGETNPNLANTIRTSVSSPRSNDSFGSRASSSSFTTITPRTVNTVTSPVVLAAASAAIQTPLTPLSSKSKSPVKSSATGVTATNTVDNMRRPMLSETRSQSNLSFDSEVLFPLEGMEEIISDNYHTDEERSDTDESGSHDEGIHIPRRVNSFVYAKSLPVDVPTFCPQQFNKLSTLPMEPEESLESAQEAFEINRSPREPMDIAASIKALARSVHGDTVFGDLPRPRFSSKI